MTKKHKPRSGSLSYYPRKRAAKETPSFTSFPGVNDAVVQPLNFFGYKAGMTHVIGIDQHKKGTTFGQQVSVPATVVEVPPLKVYGVRVYGRDEKGLNVLGEVWAEKLDRNFSRKVKGEGKKKSEGKENEKKMEVPEKKKFDINSVKGKAVKARLLVHTQPHLTGIGKKKPELSEIELSGKVEEQLNYAKEKIGKELSAKDVFKEHEFVDVKAVTKGKGIQGVIKRFGVKMFRPKAKKRRVVGSIGPWNPSTVMWTVARPGQMGYHTRTEFNKKIIAIGKENINPKAGFDNYGTVKNEYILLKGSVPGALKRCVALRRAVRPMPGESPKIEEVQLIASRQN